MAAAPLPPGPALARPLQAVMWGLRYPEFSARLRARFGATYTVRPGTLGAVVVTTDREAITALLTGDPLRKRHANDVVRPLIGDGAAILMDGEEHLARRRLLLPPFHGERVRAYAELAERLMARETARWRPGEAISVLPIAQDVTIEVILQAVLGVSDAATRTRFRRLIDNTLFYPLGAARLRHGLRRETSWSAFLGGLLTPAVLTFFPGMKRRGLSNPLTLPWWRHHDRLMAMLDAHIASTRADPGLAGRDDVLAVLVREGGLSDAHLREELLTLIAAGHETTAAAIAWGAVCLAHHPQVQERAAAADEEYLGALTREVLRFRPPLPLSAVRSLDEPLDVAGHRIPPGTMIAIDGWGLHHDPARHHDPQRFRPERFLDDGAEPYAWLPFGGGARRCVGAALAELEIRVALRTMLARWRLEPDGPRLPPARRRGIVIVPLRGGRVRLAPR